MKIRKEISIRIAMLRSIMITGVVYVHAAMEDRITGMGDGFFDYVLGFFNYAAFRVPVPLLAMVAGYLLFFSDLDLHPKRLWTKKARTVALPLFVFNLAAITLFFLLQHVFPSAIMRIDLLNASRYDWINALFSVRDVPFDYPLYFLRDLLVLVVLAPLFGIFIRRAPLLGLAIVSIVFYFNYDSYLIIRNTSAILFYVGGILAVKKYDLLKLDNYAAPLLCLFFLICLAIVLFECGNINYAAMTGPFLVWPAFKYLTNTKFGQFAARSSKYSFFVFVAHAPLLQLLRLGYNNYLEIYVPYPCFWLFAPIIVIASLMALYDKATSMAPVFFALITGGRMDNKVPVFVDRRGIVRDPSAPVYSEEYRMALPKI
jgi:succinoglycan biosynthesis protein ExoH